MKGLEIIINETSLFLDPGVSIPYELLNPAFNEIGSHTLDFSFPWTEGNKKLCGFPMRLTNVFYAEFEAKVLDNNNLFFAGTVIIKSSNEKFGNVYICLDEGDYYYLINKLNLKEVNFGTDVVLGANSQAIADAATAIVDQVYPATNFNFPLIYNPLLYGSNLECNPDYNGVMNGAWDISLYMEEFGINSINEHPTKDNKYCLVPFLYLFFIVTKIIQHLNFRQLGTFIADDDLKEILVYNNFPLDWSEKKYYVRVSKTVNQTIPQIAFPSPISFTDETTNLNEDAQGCFTSGIVRFKCIGYHTVKVVMTMLNNNAWNVSAVGQIVWGSGGGDVNTYNHDIAAGGQSAWIHEWTFYVDASMLNSNTCYYQMTALNGAVIVLAGAFITVNNNSYCSLNQYSRSINYSNHVPDITAGQFMKDVEKFYGFVTYINSIKKEHRMLSYNDIFEGTVINDITTNVLKGVELQIERVKTVQGFIFEADDFVTDNFNSYLDYIFLGDFVGYADLPEPILIGKVARVLRTNIIYITSMDDATNSIKWVEFTDDFLDLFTGNVEDEEIDLRPNAAPLLMIDYLIYFGLMPKISNAGTSEIFNTGTNDMPLRFMFYHGKDTNAYNKLFPFASTMKYGFSGDELGSFNLTVQDLTTKYYSKYIQWLTNTHKIVTIPVIFTPMEIRELKLWEKFKVGNSIGFIKSVKTALTLNNIEVCTVEFLPI